MGHDLSPQKLLAASLAIILFSATIFPSQGKVVGEVLVRDRGSLVTVNGEVVRDGRSLFSGSTIDTPADSGAIVSLGALGKIELAPATSLSILFGEDGVTGTLMAGRLTVLSSVNPISVTANGKTSSLGVGDTVEADAAQTSTGGASGNNSWVIWAVVIGGAILGVILASSGGNSDSNGGGTVPVSPTR